jgi:hypothetical protein
MNFYDQLPNEILWMILKQVMINELVDLQRESARKWSEDLDEIDRDYSTAKRAAFGYFLSAVPDSHYRFSHFSHHKQYSSLARISLWLSCVCCRFRELLKSKTVWGRFDCSSYFHY